MRIADVYACVRVLADSAASVPLISYRRTSVGRVRLSGGQLPARLISQPAPAVTEANLVSLMMTHLALWGNAYLGKFRGEDGRIEQIGLLHPDYVQVELLAGLPRYTVTDPKRGGQTYHGTDDIIHIKGLSTDGLVGLSPIRQCRNALAVACGLGAHAEAFFENGARPSGILNVKHDVSQESADHLRDQLTHTHAGAGNAHKVAIVTGDLEWTAMSGPLDDLQFCEQRRLSTTEICRIFSIPPWRIGAPSGDSNTYANVESEALSFVTHSLRPWLVVIEQAISADRDLCAGPNVYVEFLLDALLRADSATRAAVYTQALNPETGWMTRSEVRSLENLEPEGA